MSPYTPPPVAARRRMPSAIVGAVILLFLQAALALIAFGGALMTWASESADTESMTVTITAGLWLALCIFAAVGSLRGFRSAQVVGIGVGALTIIAGLLAIAMATSLVFPVAGLETIAVLYLVLGLGIIALLVAPQSARDWFA